MATQTRLARPVRAKQGPRRSADMKSPGQAAVRGLNKQHALALRFVTTQVRSNRGARNRARRTHRDDHSSRGRRRRILGTVQSR